MLRRTQHVPELNDIINTESEEQLHNAKGRDRYFMNSMNAMRRIFLFRSNVNQRNARLNTAATEHLRQALHCSTAVDNFGRAVAAGTGTATVYWVITKCTSFV